MKNIIFDMDGTILDSMDYWKYLGRDYLKANNIVPPDNLNEIIEDMTMEESSKYFIEKLGLNKDSETIIKEIYDLIEYEYENIIEPKEDIKKIILDEYEKGTSMCILTTSGYNCAEKAMKRVGLNHCFKKIITSDMLNMSKRTKDIYLKTCEIMKYNIDETIVYEDAPYAIKAAKEAGLKVVEVYDKAWDV